MPIVNREYSEEVHREINDLKEKLINHFKEQSLEKLGIIKPYVSEIDLLKEMKKKEQTKPQLKRLKPLI